VRDPARVPPLALKVIPEMHPYVRSYIDAVEGLEAQLAELIGLVRIVPALVEADRRRRWEEIGARPGDPDVEIDVEMIDVYESEA
jgi:hypothetical protein